MVQVARGSGLAGLFGVFLFSTMACNASLDGTRSAQPGPADPDPGASGGSGDATGGSGSGGAGSAAGGSNGQGAGGQAGGVSAGGQAGGVSAGGPGCSSGALPAKVRALLVARCTLCHGNPPLPTVPGSLLTIADFNRPAKTNASLSMGQASLMRITSTVATLRMPPVPAAALTPDEIQILQDWVGAGMPAETCATVGDGGVASDGGGPGETPDAGPDPFAAPPTCTSGTMWTGGTRESPLMQPGEACVLCHTRGEAPRLSFGGTVYPSAHEPSQCNGASGTGSAQGAQVVVVDAKGTSATASVNGAGNFYATTRTVLTPPLRAKVVFNGRERIMIGAVPSGDCNACHTQKGTTTVTTPGTLPAPGRIILP
jgi:hypothetical protein